MASVLRTSLSASKVRSSAVSKGKPSNLMVWRSSPFLVARVASSTWRVYGRKSAAGLLLGGDVAVAGQSEGQGICGHTFLLWAV